MKFKHCIGIGVAGNFSGHLSDANEAGDFSAVKTPHKEAPKGIFPFYIPGSSNGVLNIYPISNSQIHLPSLPADVQVEPELALLCELEYEGTLVKKIQPTHFGASNDCSIRSPGGKLSSKKNWGEHSHGLSDNLIRLESFKAGGVLDHYHLASFVKRGGTYHPYGVDSPVRTYLYFYDQLLHWIKDCMNSQVDDGPLEHFPTILKAAQYPEQALIFVGATRYEEFGKTGFLKKDDEIFVFLYDSRSGTASGIIESVKNNRSLPETCSLLHQVVK